MMQGFTHIFSGFIKKKDQHVASLCFTFLVDTGLSAYAVFFPFNPGWLFQPDLYHNII